MAVFDWPSFAPLGINLAIVALSIDIAAVFDIAKTQADVAGVRSSLLALLLIGHMAALVWALAFNLLGHLCSPDQFDAKRRNARLALTGGLIAVVTAFLTTV